MLNFYEERFGDVNTNKDITVANVLPSLRIVKVVSNFDICIR